MSDLPAHSRVGASSKKRWTACPGSVRLSEGMPSTTSIYAAEGTVAHWVGEECLKSEARLAEEFIGMTSHQDGFDIEITEEMADAVQVYIDAVDEECQGADCERLVEVKFHCTKVHPAMFGTNDCCVYNRGTRKLTVFDYKHGKGEVVEVEDNEQLMYYAVGALLTHAWPVDAIDIVIVQPRAFHPDGPVRRFSVDPVALAEWTFQLRADIEATEDPDAPLAAGDHCKFCPAAPKCPELGNQAQALAKVEFTPALAYDPKKLADTLDMLDAIESWCKRVREFAYNEAEHGRCPAGYKLVHKRAVRKLRDEEAAAKWLVSKKLSAKKDLYQQKLVCDSPAKMEKLIKDKALKAEFNEKFVTAESSGYKLVHESDKGEPIKLDAKSEFSTENC